MKSDDYPFFLSFLFALPFWFIKVKKNIMHGGLIYTKFAISFLVKWQLMKELLHFLIFAIDVSHPVLVYSYT